MKSRHSVSLSLLAIFALFCQGTGAQTQMDMNIDAGKDYQKADAELNRVYKKIFAEYKGDPKFLAKLRVSQTAWIAFRDAEMNALFPSTNIDDYGSVYPMCHSTWMAKLTSQRTKELQRWLDGVQEGDVCCGSIKVK